MWQGESELLPLGVLRLSVAMGFDAGVRCIAICATWFQGNWLGGQSCRSRCSKRVSRRCTSSQAVILTCPVSRWLDAQQGGAQLNLKPDVRLANFFEFEQPAEGYSVIYDYTYVFLIVPTPPAPSITGLQYAHRFLCALPPSLRSDWARKMTDLAAPNGTLITLQLPLDGPERTSGPPYSLWDGLYHDLLDKDWEMVYQRDVTQEESRLPSPEGIYKLGREKIAVWRRRS
jgi:hypothetical protein